MYPSVPSGRQTRDVSNHGMMADGSEVSRKVASSLKLDQQVVARLVSLLDDENTIPFIARYRQENTGGLDPVALRRIQSEVQRIRFVHTGIQSGIHRAQHCYRYGRKHGNSCD